MTTSVIKSTLGTLVNGTPAYRDINYSSSDRVAVRATNQCLSYFYFARPGPLKCKYNSVKLQIRCVGAYASATYTLKRLTSKYSNSSVVWNGHPTSTSTNQVVVTQAFTTGGQILEFDITAMMQDVSDGAPWYGVELTVATTSITRYFYNQRAPAKLIPVVQANWSDAPVQPISLNPSDGRVTSLAKPVVSCDHVDVSGDTTLAAIQVQINSTNVWTSPSFDSGTVATTVPALDLNTTAYAGIGAGATVWWRVRLQDGSGLWSSWSEGTSMKRVAKGTLTVSSPSSGSPVVNDSTPTILWSTSGMTQASYQVLLFTSDGSKLLWDSGRRAGTNTSTSILAGIVSTINASYKLAVRVWDTEARATTSGDVAYVEVTRVFQFVQSNTVTPVGGLTVVADSSGRPWVVVTFTRAAAPDSFSFEEDGVVVKQDIVPGEVFVSGTTYSFVYRLSSPRTSHVYKVNAVENGVQSSVNPSVTLTLKPDTAWICSQDGTYYIPLTNYTNGLKLKEDSSAFQVLGSSESVAIYSGIGGFEGPFSGVMTKAVGTQTAAQYLAQLLALRSEMGTPMILTFADQSVPCVLKDIDYTPVVYKEEIVYAVSFTVIQKRRP